MQPTVAQDPIRVIHTPDQRLRVFVSSTLGELAAERDAVRGAIEQLRLVPVMFELGARAHPPQSLYRAYLQQSDVFLGVYWQRYGWVAPDMAVSGLEDEYLLAGDRPRLIYIKEPSDQREPRLAELLVRVKSEDRASYKRFSSTEELAALVADDLAILLTERFAAAQPRPQTGGRLHLQPLPVPPTSLVGRERQVKEVAEQLARREVRLLTLTGPGGIGKTRLALDVAGRLMHRFAGGVHMVPLAAVLDPALVLPTLAATLGVRAEGGRPLVERLAAELAELELLLVLDNFEQVLDAGPAVAELLSACPGLTALVTSRASLRLRGEHQYPVPPLEVAAAGAEGTPQDLLSCSAVALFVARAREARFDVALDDTTLDAVAELCRRLDGIPLAIELAAARTRLLSPQALLDRLGDRLDLLSANLADLPSRHRTLRATIDWSYHLLEAAEQALFRRLGVFAASVSLPAAAAVHGGDEFAALETIGALVEHSLLVADPPESGEPRFHLLRTVREYARERLVEEGEFDEAAARHLRYFVGVAQEAEPCLRGPAQQAWMDRLDRDLDDLRSALRWALEHDPAAAVVLGYGLRIFWWLGDHMAEARRYAEDALATLDRLEAPDQACVLFMAGGGAWVTGDYATAEARLRESLALARELGDAPLAGGVLVLLAPLAHERGEADAAEAALAEALATARAQEGDPWGVAYVLLQYAQLAARTGDLERAGTMSRELLEIARSLENLPFIAHALAFLSYLSLRAGDLAGSRELLSEAARIYRGLRYREGLGYCLVGFAGIALADRDAERAATELGAAAALRELIGQPPWAFMRPIVEGLERTARGALGEPGFQRAWEAGRAMSPDAMALYALGAEARVEP